MPLKKVINKQLGELLMDFGVINNQQLEAALATQKQKGAGLLGEILVEKGFAKEEDIAQALTVQYGFPYLPLSSYEISAEVIALVPVATARKHILIPIDRIGSNLTLVMANPLNQKAIEEVEAHCGCSVQIFVSTMSEIKNAIARYYS